MKVWIQALLLAAAALFAAAAFAADDPSMHDVYVAAEAGRLSEAQAMMDKVLKDHPDSAKAHYVEAELMAKQGQMGGARMELDTAERLAPGLPFAQPQAVHELQARIEGVRRVQPGYVPAGQVGGTHWGMIFLGIALLAIIIFAIRAMSRPRFIPAGGSYPAYPPGAQPYGAGPYGPYGGGVGPVMGGGGLGSGIVGGLATGAAVGAGMVAGEELMHHFTDGNRGSGSLIPDAQANDSWSAPDNMGGSDFGVGDSGSWDDSSGGGGGGGDW